MEAGSRKNTIELISKSEELRGQDAKKNYSKSVFKIKECITIL